MRNSRLPPDFADLAPFLDDWALATEQERYVKLLATPLPELRLFYDAMLKRSDAIVAYLSRFPLDALPAEARLLYELMVTFIETAHPIDLGWRQTNIEHGGPPEQLRFHGPSAEPAVAR